MKVSELKSFFDTLPDAKDPDIVTGEIWLPERLTDAQFDGEMVHLEFDNAPDEIEGDEEARGFVEHELTMIKDKIEQLMLESHDSKTKAEIFLKLFVMGHEKSSSDIIEILEDPESWDS
ncbi:hypothetical protein L3Q72_07755 [Vibrio sp. JC009]|uniref:hypothetical protein n=1 Tax=Vibrio sp. JC009 TaxID=2912314 RepID=UPI0023B1FC8D|nr:hypothetical protein [Vibrio sp. JC009]WED20549.1 hypothetical protein L3Q72_07755 [Vibrio sp. JC009]